MRIALDARKLTSSDSGIGNYTLNLARALLEEDKDLELLLLCNGTRGQRLWQGPRVKELLFPFPALSPFTQLALGPFLRQQTFDVFHAPFDVAPRRLHRPLVVTIHDLNWLVNPRYNSAYLLPRLFEGTFFRSSLAAAMQEASRLLAVSQATRPYVTSEVLNALYNTARIVLHPSYYEGFGLPLLEAMATAVPLVTADISSMPEVAGSAALLVSPADYRAIAEALVTLDQDEVLRARLIAEGRARLEHFSWNACVQAVLAIYRELV